MKTHHIGSSAVISTVAEGILGPFGDRVSNARSRIYAKKIAKACRVRLRLACRCVLNAAAALRLLMFDGRLQTVGDEYLTIMHATLSLFRAYACLSAWPCF
jgi:hypothetical protein